MPTATKGRVNQRAAGSGFQHTQGLFQKNGDVFHALACRPQPEDFPSDGTAQTDDFVGISFRKLHHTMTLHPPGTVSAAGKAASEFASHHLLPVHIHLLGQPT
jgi:hypothetical protein